MGGSFGKGLRRSRLLRLRSALLARFSAASLDPESVLVLGHSERDHFARLSAVAINAICACAMQIECAHAVESLMACAALAAIAG
jgi:hypothetical protein